MMAAISLDEMKLEANWFLKKISAFNAQAHIVIDEQMVKLLYHTTQKIADCVDRSKIASDTNNNKQNVDVLFDIDESCYRYHRSIMCTICGVNMEIKKGDYLQHVNGERHKRNVSAMANGLHGDPNGCNVAGSIMGVDDLPASLLMRTKGSHTSNNNHISTGEFFHLPSPTPRGAMSSNLHSLSRATSTSSIAKELTLPMGNLNLNASGNPSGRQMIASPNAAINNPTDTKSEQFKEIRLAIKSVFPKSKVFFYGSHNYGLADENSDFNAYIDLDGNTYNLQRTKSIMQDRQKMISQKLQGIRNQWRDVKCDQRLVLYPLVRATSVPLGINCTFSFGTGIFVEANYLIKEFMSRLPISHAMVSFLKTWQRKINRDAPKSILFSTYQLTILVICYFQIGNYLPSVQSLQSKTDRSYCGDAQIDYKKPIPVLKPTKNELFIYLLEFFSFFGNQYKPSQDILSAYYGKLLKRNYRNENDRDNWELCKYVKNANQTLWNEPHAHMYVHDLYLQSSCPNVTANISSAALHAFQSHCKLTAEFCASHQTATTTTILDHNHM